MTRAKRRLIFYSLIFVFIIITPATILYATGYSFDWQKKQVEKTGGLFLKSLPEKAEIFINGELKDETPALISRLLPRQYLIEVSKDNFYTWQKNLSVQSQLVTEARNIILVSKNPKMVLVSENATSTQEYFLTDEQKRIIEQASSTIASVLKGVSSWALFENSIYYLQKSNLILYKTDLAGSSKEQISFEPLPALPANIDLNDSYQIKNSSEQIAVFEPGGKLYLLNQKLKIFELLADNVQGVEFSPDNEKILYWTNHEIWVVWLKDILTQPYRKAGDKELITRYGDKITQAVWLAKTSEHIIYAAADATGLAQIKIAELDGRDTRNTFDIYSAQNPEIYWNQKDNLLYLLTQRKFYSLDLLNE